MLCHRCGATRDAGASFCQRCGAPVAAADPSVAMQAPAERSGWGWFTHVLTRRYASFQGRARRKEYWYFTLFFALIWIGLVIVDGATGSLDTELGMGMLSGLWMLACLVPSVAVAVRRLHDTGRTGWWFLISLVPLVGPIVVLVFCALEGEAGANRYGPSPKGAAGT